MTDVDLDTPDDRERKPLMALAGWYPHLPPTPKPLGIPITYRKPVKLAANPDRRDRTKRPTQEERDAAWRAKMGGGGT